MPSEFIFDTPWWALLLLLVAGAAVFVAGNRRQNKLSQRAGIGVLLLAGLLFALSYFVETAREYCVRRTRQLVQATDQKDWSTFKANLDPKTEVLMFKGPDVITHSARLAAERVQLGKVVITGMEVAQTDAQIEITVRVFSEQLPMPGASDWRLQFLRDGDRWVLYRVEPLASGTFNPEHVARELQRN